MNFYNVYCKRRGSIELDGMMQGPLPAMNNVAPSANLEDYVFVKDGFSYWAFFFNSMWMFYHRMWSCGLIFMGLYNLPFSSSAYNYMFTLNVCAGFLGNDLRAFYLRRKGCVLVDVVAAKNELQAKKIYFDLMGDSEEMTV